MELRWDRLCWQDFEKLLGQGYRSVILPVGTIEAHGVIPLGTDNFIPEAIAGKIADDLKAFVAPTVNYGITHSLLGYPGSLTVTSTTFRAYIRDILHSMAGKGIQSIIVLNGHGGQMDELKEAAFEIFKETGIKIIIIHWWILCADLVAKFYGTEGGHAAVDETAAIIASAPEMVKKEYYDPKMLYSVTAGAATYPIPSTILVYKDNTGALDFSEAKAQDYFDSVCSRVREFVLDTYRRWGIKV